jgi:hypothetical protein
MLQNKLQNTASIPGLVVLYYVHVIKCNLLTVIITTAPYAVGCALPDAIFLSRGTSSTYTQAQLAKQCAAGKACTHQQQSLGGREGWLECTECGCECMDTHTRRHGIACKQAVPALAGRCLLAEVRCAGCSKTQEEVGRPLCKCSRCNAALYCSTGCQRQHWPYHKHPCTRAKNSVRAQGH